MPASFTIEVNQRDLQRLIKKCVTDPVYRKPARAMMGNVARVAESYVRRGAPRGRTGQLSARISSKVFGGPIPSALVKTDAMNPRGGRRGRPYPYPRLLEFSQRHHHYHWMRNAIQQARGAINGQISRAASVIASEWGR